jgi:hypothetical protein
MAAKTVTKDIITLRGSAAIVSEFFGIIHQTLLFIFSPNFFHYLSSYVMAYFLFYFFHQSSGYAANRFEFDPLFSNFVYHIF